MVKLIPLAEARVLVVGADNLVDEIIRNLVSSGVNNLTILDGSKTATKEKPSQFIHRDPEEFIKEDVKYFKSFDIVLCANQPREFEVELADARWPISPSTETEPSIPDLPMVVMRSVSNTCKMRCQYRELAVNGLEPSRYVRLTMDLPEWTKEKRALVASTIQNEFKPDQDPTFQAYLAAALAVIEFQQSKGSWPGSGDKEQVQGIVKVRGNSSDLQIGEFIDQFCHEGLAAAKETIAIIARLVVLDVIKLLTGNGQPINHTDLEEVIRIAATA